MREKWERDRKRSPWTSKKKCNYTLFYPCVSLDYYRDYSSPIMLACLPMYSHLSRLANFQFTCETQGF